jgi:alpha-tubulin suppressor-like RCC1 family protein
MAVRMPNLFRLGAGWVAIVTCLVCAPLAHAAQTSGSLTVRVASLPSGLRARVVVSALHRTWPVARARTLHLAPGSYRVVARPVLTRGEDRYFPVLASQRVVVRPGRVTGVTADYATIVPWTTRTPPARAVIAVSGHAGGMQTLALRRAAAAEYRVGDLIASGSSRIVPNGLIVSIVRVIRRTANTILFRVVPATLAQALPRSVVDARVPAAAPSGPILLTCGTATATITAGLGVALRAHLETGGGRPHLTVASFELTPSARTGVTVTTTAGGSCDISRSIAVTPARVTVHAGPVPIVLVPRVATNVSLTGDYAAGVTATGLQTVAGTVLLTYDGRAWRHAAHLTRTTEHSLDDSQAPAATGTSLTAAIAPTATILVDGLAGPHLRFADSPSLAFAPASGLDLAHTTSAAVGLERATRPLTDHTAPRDATVLQASETLEHRTLASAASGGGSGPGSAESSTQITAGDKITCALPQGGRLFCWGAGAIGDGARDGSATPVAVSGLTTVQQASAGGRHACAVLSSGAVDCWGEDDDGEVGNGVEQADPVVLPTPVQGITTAVQVSAGENHTCALLADGTVRCWGRGFEGELGDGQTGPTASSPVPVTVTGVTTATQISAGGSQTCALLADASVTCWGLVSGDGQAPHASGNQVRVRMAAAVQVSAAQYHACALLRSGLVLCWGTDDEGQLGDNGPSSAYTPLPVDLDPVTEPVAQISAGDDVNCAVLRDHTIRCWGLGGSGQLGNATTQVIAPGPVAVSGITDSVRVSAGSDHVCAVLRDGALRCWGDNKGGELGTGTSDRALLPRTVVNLSGAAQISAGYQHTCALLSSGAVDCWGDNSRDQLGNGAIMQPSSMPLPVPGLAPAIATQISAGPYHTCARLQGGTIACWGDNIAPHLVAGITTAIQVAAGDGYNCAVLANGTVACWGANDFGQLGNGTTMPSATPVLASGITTATQVTVNAAHTCAVLQGGTVSCWGDGFYGELGNDHTGPTAGSSVPVPVVGISASNPASQVTAGYRHTCAVMQNGTVSCWGRGTEGELGNGLKLNNPDPTTALGIDDAVAVDAGSDHSCAVRAGGGLSCWGLDSYGQVGDGGTAQEVLEPANVNLIGNVTQVDAGNVHTCARRTDGTVACWGFGADGEIGDGATGFAETPVSVTGLPGS